MTDPSRSFCKLAVHRRSRLVLITRDLDRAALVASVRLLHDPAVVSSESIERAIRAANPGAA